MKCSKLTAVCLATLLIGCGPEFLSQRNIDQHDYIVAQADTLYSITIPQLYRVLEQTERARYGGMITAEEVADVLDSILCDTLAGFRADDLNLGDYYNYYNTYEKRYFRYLITRYFEEEVYKKVSVDSQEVVDFRAGRPDLFALDEQVLVRQILISPVGLKNGPDSVNFRTLTEERLNQEMVKYVYQIRRMLDFGVAFEEVAGKYSHDEMSARQGGLVGWTKRRKYEDPFDSIAFSIQPGEISEPYQDNSGWHILYIEERIDEGLANLDKEQYEIAEASLSMSKGSRRMNPLRDSLFDQVELAYNEAVLDSNIDFMEITTWAAIVNGQDTINVDEMGRLERSYRGYRNVKNTTPEMKKEIILTLAERYSYVQGARAAGIDTIPDVVAEEKALRHKYSKEIIAKQGRSLGWIPPKDLVQKYFDEHIEEFTVEAGVHVQHIIVDDSVFGEFVRDQAMAGVDFLELAKEYYPGEPGVRADLADLGMIGPEDVPPELYTAASVTPVGVVTHPVKTQYGYHIIKVVSRTEPTRLHHVSSKINEILRKQQAREIFNRYRDDLYTRYNVRFKGKLYPVHLRPMTSRNE
ncbi:MAG: peptidylprolyl isomerase [bacterium]